MKVLALVVFSVFIQGLLAGTLPLVPYPREVSTSGGSLVVASLNAVKVEWVGDEAIPAEGYVLQVQSNGVTLAARDAAGELYARETLKQLARPAAGGYELPQVVIRDWPTFKWRGVHFDDSRHFFGKETLKRTMDEMVRHKLNVLHWHLTDDQGWRLDIPGYPELVKYGAVRPVSPKRGAKVRRIAKGEYTIDTNSEPYGPYYYTEADVKEILAYAAARNITVVPEIELPGHVFAALAAYPEFACRPENLSKRIPCIRWGIEKDVLCLGNDEAIKFMEDVVDYVARLFPGEIVHIGGDECPQERWKECPKCRARIAAEGLGDEHGLQPWISRRFVDFLAARGKRAIGWDEYLLGDVPQSAIGMSWRTHAKGGAGHQWLSPADMAAKGHDVVMCPNKFCYLDFAQCLPDDPMQYIGGELPLEKAYSLDPYAGVPEDLRSHILGGQGNNWSEYTWNESELNWKMWPRMSALAEVFWTGEQRPGFADFKERMRIHRKRLIADHVNCAPLE